MTNYLRLPMLLQQIFGQIWWLSLQNDCNHQHHRTIHMNPPERKRRKVKITTFCSFFLFDFYSTLGLHLNVFGNIFIDTGTLWFSNLLPKTISIYNNRIVFWNDKTKKNEKEQLTFYGKPKKVFVSTREQIRFYREKCGKELTNLFEFSAYGLLVGLRCFSIWWCRTDNIVQAYFSVG